MSVKVKAAEMTDVDAVAFEEATFLATHPDRALFPETGVKVTTARRMKSQTRKSKQNRGVNSVLVTRQRYTDKTIRVRFLADRGLLLPVPLMRDKGTGFEVLKGESVAYHVLELLDV